MTKNIRKIILRHKPSTLIYLSFVFFCFFCFLFIFFVFLLFCFALFFVFLFFFDFSSLQVSLCFTQEISADTPNQTWFQQLASLKHVCCPACFRSLWGLHGSTESYCATIWMPHFFPFVINSFIIIYSMSLIGNR